MEVPAMRKLMLSEEQLQLFYNLHIVSYNYKFHSIEHSICSNPHITVFQLQHFFSIYSVILFLKKILRSL